MRCLLKGILLLTLILGILYFAIKYWNNIEPNRIKKLPNKLELLTKIAYQIQTENLLDSLSQQSKSNELLINEMVSELELCSIKNYSGMGVAYYFKCKNDSYDNFIDTDEEYYLVKVYDKNSANDFLSYEQFIDYGGPPEDLSENWYFFEKHIYFD